MSGNNSDNSGDPPSPPDPNPAPPPNPSPQDDAPATPAGAFQVGPQTPGPIMQPVLHAPVSARVPESVSRGVFATGVIAQEGQGEFVLDFFQSLTRPPQIAARVVMTPGVMRALVSSLAENIARYTATFGPPPTMPRPAPGAPRHTTQELYEHFKLPESLWSGVYANSVLIGHNAGEFFLDFITRFYPQAAVSCRVYLSAGQTPRVHETLASSMQQYLAKKNAPPPSAPPPNPESEES